MLKTLFSSNNAHADLLTLHIKAETLLHSREKKE
jgi:hypothetical protein